jgi:uncharacterized protein (DUF169 family)
MWRQETARRRMRALDGTSFRFERKGDDLFVNGMLAHVQALSGGMVALVTERKSVQVSAADYWEMVYDEVFPTKLLAGVLLAQLHEIRQRLKGIAASQQDE